MASETIVLNILLLDYIKIHSPILYFKWMFCSCIDYLENIDSLIYAYLPIDDTHCITAKTLLTCINIITDFTKDILKHWEAVTLLVVDTNFLSLISAWRLKFLSLAGNAVSCFLRTDRLPSFILKKQMSAKHLSLNNQFVCQTFPSKN